MTEAVVETPSEAIARAVALAGSEDKLAKAVRCRQSYISKAKLTGRCSDKIAIRIHVWSNGEIPGSAIRPDLWTKPEHVPLAPVLPSGGETTAAPSPGLRTAAPPSPLKSEETAA